MRAKLFCLGLLGLLCLVAHVNAGNFWAGVSKIDATMPIGAPLAGYNYPPRRHDNWPIPTFNGELYTTWMTPSKGRFNPTWAKCVVLSNGQETFAFVTVDVIGADGTLAKLAYDIAITQGFNVTFQNFMLSGSHTHSGPGAITAEFLWSIAPATDAVVPALQIKMAQYIAKAMVEAYRNMEPAVIDFGLTNLTGVTHNRRSGFSPYVQSGTIDPNLGVVRIDKPDGTPLATIWNYAIHGICFDAGNLFFSSDVMGSVCEWIEDNVGGLAVFWNGDAGDISPIFSVCCQDMPNFSGGPVIGQAVAELRSTLKPTNDVQMWSAQNTVDFGVTVTNFTLARLDNCTQGGPMNICSICEVLDCDLNLGLGSAWIENQPVFSAFRFFVNNKNTILTSIPGEALVELGWNIRNDTADLGYDQTFLVGYTNNHLGYFCTPNEYDIGGYESTLTLWGINTAQMIQDGCYSVTSVIAPNPPSAIIATVDENAHQTKDAQQATQ